MMRGPESPMPPAFDEHADEPSLAEIRRRIDAYLSSPGLSADDRDYVATWLTIHPEVAEAVADSHLIQVNRLTYPRSILGRAHLVFELHHETKLLVPRLPPLVADLRDLAERLARDVCWLVRS